MEKLLYDILNVLEKVNGTLPKQALDQKDFDETKGNIEKYIWLKKETKSIVTALQNINAKDKEAIANHTIELYVNYTNMAWHVHRIDELIIKVMVSLPVDSFENPNDEYAEYCNESRRKSINKLDKTLEKMILMLEKINLLMSQKNEKTTLAQKKMYIKNFFSLRNKLVDLVDETQGLLRSYE